MNKRICIAGVLVLLVAAAGIIYLQISNDPGNETGNTFDNGGRYNSTILDFMGVIYNNQSDIAFFNEGYSESDNCPWGFVHNGIDYFFSNDSVVIAAAPGVVENIELGYLEGSTVYKVAVQIRFNDSVWIDYGFEGNSPDEAVRAQQAAMLDVEIGDWVAKGDQIGRFLRPTEYDHIHFGVYMNNEAICPRLVMGETDYIEIMSLIHSFHPLWELCYP